jgi:transcriptional regulator with XRE-family HTH domain
MEPDETRKSFGDLVGERLREVRGPRPQEWIAERGGVHQQTIWRYEKGEIPASWAFLARLAESEGINLNDLLAMPTAVEV